MSATRDLAVPTREHLAAARRLITDHLEPTPLVERRIAGRRFFLKLETDQPTGSFKVRGALAALGADPDRRAVVTCSAGNHGLGIARAANQLGIRACVVVPATASPAKVAKLRSFDIELLEVGENYDEAERYALDLAAARGLRYVSPYNDSFVIAGQATVANEVLEQCPDVAHLFVAIGGGGLAAGCALSLSGTGVELHGAQVEHNAAFTSLFLGERPGGLEPTIADGIAGGIEADAVTLSILQDAAFDLTLVSEESTKLAMQTLFNDAGLRVEGSAAVAFAAALDRQELSGPVCVVLSGSNITDELFDEVVQA